MNSPIPIRVLLALASVAFLAATAHGQTTWYVDDDNCPGPGGGSEADPFCAIQDGIGAASDGDTVLVEPGVYHEFINFLGKAITLRSSAGPDVTTIDAPGSYYSVVRCVSDEGPDTVLEGFTITGGNTDDLGGGMYNYASSPTVTNCTFTGNTANHGGGMYNYASSPTVTGCTFTGNTTLYGGGGMLNDVNSSPMVTDCTFSENTASSGGGMYNSRNSSPIVTDCTFSENTASYGGGGMSNYDSSPTVTNCTFAGNTATDDGGRGEGGEAGHGGGMKNESNSSPTVTGCTLIGNTASDGGGMYNHDSTPTVTGCTFTGNGAEFSGGGVLNSNSASTLSDCAFAVNTALDGGGMYNEYGRPTVTNCTFSGNTADLDGGGMYNHEAAPAVTNCTFTLNTAGDGGGMYNFALDWWSEGAVTNCTFSGNTADLNGGGMYNEFSEWAVTNCMFTGNTAGEFGGAMINDGSNPIITNCTYSANQAAFGGGMFIGGGYATLTNSILWGNCDDGGCDETAQIHVFSSDPDVNYSCVQGGWTGEGGTGNINANPQFASPPDPGADGIWGTDDDDYGDLRLLAESPSIDAGSNGAFMSAGASSGVTIDLGGNARFMDHPATPDTGTGLAPIIDMGVYELGGTPGDYDNDGDVDLLDFSLFMERFTGP